MAKVKRNKGVQQSPISPTQYIKERVRLLPIDKCLVNADWQKVGLASIMVVRRHPQGTFTAGLYLVDILCRGVYDSFYVFSVDSLTLSDLISQFEMSHSKSVEYTVVHNIIYGAIDFAEEGGISPCKEFALTRYILEEDTDDIPLIEYEFGENGKHALYVNSLLEAGEYLPALKKKLGDDYELIIQDEDDEDDEDDVEFDDELDDDEIFPYLSDWNPGLDGEYTYKHPHYPSEDIKLKHPWLEKLLTEPQKDALTNNELKKILALPYDELRSDLEQLAYRELARNSKGIYEDYNPLIGHVVLLLGEINDERSLKLILEIMRQDEEFRDYHFGDFSEYILEPPLYRLTKTNPALLLRFLKEPGLYSFFRYNAMQILLQHIPYFEPSRKEECIGYGREFIDFLIEHSENPLYMDGTLAGFLCSSLIDLHATKLMPQIEKLYATGNVDESVAGTIEEIQHEMEQKSIGMETPVPFDLNKIYAHIKEYSDRFYDIEHSGI